MNPSDTNSALATLRQLKEMLDAGALTPQEFDALKKKLLFGPEAAGPSTSTSTEPPVSENMGRPAPAVALGANPPVAPAKAALPPAPAVPEGTDWSTTTAPASLENALPDPFSDAPEERRNPLTLVFLIGGALVLLALVLYLTLGGNTPDEHLTSTSQTAADSTSTTPEVGPQAEQLALPPATPETIRVAPVVAQAPVAKPAVRADSVGAVPAATVPAAKPVVPAPAKAAVPAPTPPVVPAAKPDTTKAGRQ